MELTFWLGGLIGFVVGGIISVVFFHRFLQHMRKLRDNPEKGGK